jgi:hypothetical protein
MGKWPFDTPEWKKWLANRTAGRTPAPPRPN